MRAYLSSLVFVAVAGCSLYVDDDDNSHSDAGPAICRGDYGDPCFDYSDCGSSICGHGVCTRECTRTPDGAGCGESGGFTIQCSATQPFTTGVCLYHSNDCVLPARDAGTD